MEPRMRQRHKGQQFSTSELEAMLYAFGDDKRPLPETVRLLDEIITDFIIETSHSAALCATYSHRAKIKVDDFKFAMRKDPRKLGRSTYLVTTDKELKERRKMFNTDEGKVQKGGLVDGVDVGDDEEGDENAEEGESVVGKKRKGKGKGKGQRGRKKKKKVGEEDAED